MPRIVAIHYSYYPNDVRPRREAEALVEAGMSVDVICLRMDGQVSEEICNGVHVHRISMQRIRSGKLNYVTQYVTFIIHVFIKLTIMHCKNRYDIVHVHNMPDILVFVALLPKLSGSKIMLDLHDPMPELYMTKFSIGKDHYIVRLLEALEQMSIKFSDVIITPNESFKNIFISRGCPENKIFIVMNSPMEKIFNLESEEQNVCKQKYTDRFILMFHGGIFERHGLDTALEAVANLNFKIPNIELQVFGEGDYLYQFLKLVDKYGLKRIVKFKGAVSLEVIKDEILKIDVGIIPNKVSPFTNINLPVRIFEYLSLHKPVIVPKTDGIMEYFDEKSIFYFEGGNAKSLSDVITKIYRDPVWRQEVIDRGVAIYNKHRWSLQRQNLISVVNGQLDTL